MFKNKFKIISIFLVIILFIAPIVRADDTNSQNSTNEQVIADAENTATEASNSQETYKDSDLYLTGDEVTIDYIVDGNIFIFANTVNINSQIGGDAFIVANNINVNEGGYIFSNLFALAPNVTINGIVYDLYSYSNNVKIGGYIYRDVKVKSNTFSLSGTIGRNAYLNSSTIEFINNSEDENNATSKGSINGNLNYTSSQEISIPENSVLGETTYTQPTKVSFSTYLLLLGRFLVTVIVIWLICLFLAPKFLKRTDAILTKKLPSTIGFGILTPILCVLICALLLLISITTSISGIGLGILFIICAISSPIFVITINNIICNKLNINKTIGKFGVLILSALILWLVALIPFIGGLISIIATILGIGILVNSLLPKNKDIDLLETSSSDEKTKNKTIEKIKEKINNSKKSDKSNKSDKNDKAKKENNSSKKEKTKENKKESEKGSKKENKKENK